MNRKPHFHWMAVAMLMVAAACGGGDSAEPPRQIDLAPASDAEPQLTDEPLPEAAPAKAPTNTPTKAPVTRQPVPTAPVVEQRPIETPVPAPVVAVPVPEPSLPPAPTTGEVAVGTSFTVKPATKICTNTHKVGDRFTATLSSAVQGSNGVEIPAGSIAILRILEAPADQKGSERLRLDIISVRVGDQTYEVVAHVAESAPLSRVNAQTTGDKAKKIGTGAAIGAIAGRVLGGNTKSTVLGGAIGAAAGAAVAAGDTRYEGCLADDAAITLVLDRPLVLRVAP